MKQKKPMYTYWKMGRSWNIPMENMDIITAMRRRKQFLNRLSRAIGHLESIKRMVEDGRDCSEVLIQLSAVKSAINNTGKIILQDHIEHCIVDAVEHGDKDAIKELERAIDRFMK